MRWSQAEWTRPLARPDAPFRRVPGWSAAVRMIAVGYRYLSPVPGMSVEVRVPAEGVCGAGRARARMALSGRRVFGCSPTRWAPVSRIPSMTRYSAIGRMGGTQPVARAAGKPGSASTRGCRGQVPSDVVVQHPGRVGASMMTAWSQPRSEAVPVTIRRAVEGKFSAVFRVPCMSRTRSAVPASRVTLPGVALFSVPAGLPGEQSVMSFVTRTGTGTDRRPDSGMPHHDLFCVRQGTARCRRRREGSRAGPSRTPVRSHRSQRCSGAHPVRAGATHTSRSTGR